MGHPVPKHREKTLVTYARDSAEVRGLVGKSCGERCAARTEPRLGSFEPVVDVLDALIAEPAFEHLHAVLRTDRDAVLPCRTATEDAGKIRTGFGGDLERFGEDIVIHSCGEINERLLRRGGNAP